MIYFVLRLLTWFSPPFVDHVSIHHWLGYSIHISVLLLFFSLRFLGSDRLSFPISFPKLSSELLNWLPIMVLISSVLVLECMHWFNGWIKHITTTSFPNDLESFYPFHSLKYIWITWSFQVFVSCFTEWSIQFFVLNIYNCNIYFGDFITLDLYIQHFVN